MHRQPVRRTWPRRRFKVGLYLHNCSEYQEAQFGIFKVSGCPINVNYRYKSDELVYLLENTDTGLSFQSCYAMRIWEIRERLPKVKLFVQIDDGTESLLKGAVDYEQPFASTSHYPAAYKTPKGYICYTGGTTGMQGVYRQSVCAVLLSHGCRKGAFNAGKSCNLQRLSRTN